MVKKADTNKDGYVDSTEFSNFLKQDLYTIANSIGVEIGQTRSQTKLQGASFYGKKTVRSQIIKR